MLVAVVGLSACARPNPLYGLPAATEGAATEGTPMTSGTTRTLSDTGRPDDGGADAANGVDGADAAQTQAGDDEPTTEADPADTGPKLDLSDGVVPESACCDPTPDAAGCGDADLEECVCTLDAYCCDTEWDQTCVDIGIAECGAVCFHDGSCCAPSTARGCSDDAMESCVCDINPGCCDEAWNIGCVTIADRACSEGCFTGDNDCCFATLDDVGCNQAAAWTCVCPQDPWCCENNWDAFCVGVAVDCGFCPLPGSMSDCCMESPPGGCLDHALGPGVMNCVCEMNLDCCTGSWNVGCVQLGIDQCTLVCG